MKNKVLSFAIALIAFFAFNTAQAQNPHFEDVVVSEDGLTITGKIAGLGNKYTGQSIALKYGSDVLVTMNCYNPTGKLLANKTETFRSETASTTAVTGKNGHVKFTLTITPSSNPLINAGCDGNPNDGHGLRTVFTYSGNGSKTLSFTVAGITKEMVL
jgi:hypothetical protein